jgi:uncharacterized LabA/DUF88 family protein
MKTVWIIDGAYLLKGSPQGENFDYVKLRKELENKNGSVFSECFYLNSTQNPSSDAQDSFHSWLKMAAPIGPKFRLQLYKLKELTFECPGCRKKITRQVQKGVDVAIATLLIKLAVQNKYDRVILSAGDGDFEAAVEYIKDEHNKEFMIAGFDGSVSPDLQSYANEIIWINELWENIKKQR